VLKIGVQLCIGLAILKTEVNQVQDNRIRVRQLQGVHKARLPKEMMAATAQQRLWQITTIT
jgi:hypothetical protein